MNKKRVLSLILAITFCFSLFPSMTLTAVADDPEPIPIYMDPSYTYAERAADLVARLDVLQKARQVSSQNIPAVQPSEMGGGALNVPATVGIGRYTWWQEALHGYLNASNANSYPQNTSIGNTWNPELYYRVATEIADEIRERAPKYSTVSTNGIVNASNLNFYSPTINMHRDPRWGRNEESYSEDVYLMSKMGSAFVKGMQGYTMDGQPIDPKGRRKVNTTIKHYVANNSENNRLTGGAVTSLRALREYYAAPYRNIIQDANVASVMTAYSTLNGDPCTWSSYLIETLLRQTYGFTGFTTGDCDSINTIRRHNFTNPYTGKVLTVTEMFAQAMAHGMDLQCNGGHGSDSGDTYYTLIANSNMLGQNIQTDKGIYTENQLDIALHRLFTARMLTGEWDTDNAFTQEAAERTAQQSSTLGWQTPERLQLIDEVNAEAVVMLKNEAPAGSTKKILPLDIPESGDYKVVIVGAWQTNRYTGLYSGSQSDNRNRITIQERIVSNIREKNPNATITTLTSYGNSTSASSYTITDTDRETIANADAVIVVVGTPENYSREDGDRASTVFNNGQATLISNVGKINPKTIAVMETCGPMDVTEFENDVAAILWSSYLGNRKVGFGDIITGKVNPSGKLTDTWYRKVSNTGPSDIPSIYDYDLFPSEGKQGRTYMYFNGTPQYPFGYGLSFTTFEYDNLTIKKGNAAATEFDANDTITVTFDVKNTGSVAGKETVQLYVAQPNAPAELKRPIKRLMGFDKIELAPGETKTVTLEVNIPDLAFYNEEQDRFIVDTGLYEIQVGPNSANVPLTGRINVSGTMNIVPAVLTIKAHQEGDEALGVEERLIFDKGKKVVPKVTVAMNDESLYGYIIKQQSSLVKKMTSTPLPEGMTVTYTSNRPAVADVVNGEIKTLAPGVATITATATYNGVSVSTDFVVYVVSSPYLEDIKVNGESISGFSKDKFNYSIEVPAGTTTVPTIEPVSANEDLEITIEKELESIPGVKVIRSTNKLTGETVVYRVGVGYKPVTTDFKEGEAAALAKGWSFLNKNDNAVFGENGLTIKTERGSFASATNKPKNVLMTSALGTWIAQTKVTLDATPSASNQQAGLIVYDDDNNYIRFVYERPTSGTSNALAVYRVADGVQSSVNSVNLASLTSIYIQVVKENDTYTFMYSQDGINWTTFANKAIVNYAYPQIGIYATNGDTDAASISATFDGLLVSKLSDLYPRLETLKINGIPLASFDPTVYFYNIEVPDSTTETPVIEAIAEESEFRVDINYDQIANGKGVIDITVYSAVASTTYSLCFNTTPKSEYFADGTMGPQWTVLNENKDTYAIVKGLGLELPTQRYDIHTGGGRGLWNNCVVQPAMGNWEVVAKVFYPNVPTANYQQAMLLVWQDEDNYIRANCQQSSLRLEPGVEINGSFNAVGSGTAYANSDGTVVMYHKIKKEGNNYTISFSQNGIDFTDLATVNVNLKNPKIGLFATQNSTSTQMNTYFEYLTVTNLNGVQQRSYVEMLEDAVANVAKYVAEDIPTVIDADTEYIEFSRIPYGYTMNVISSDPSVISSDGKVTPPASGSKTVTLTVNVTDGVRTATSDPITVTVKGSEDVNEFEISTNFNVTKLVANEMLVADVSVKNIGSAINDVLVITALYDKNERMLNVSYLSKNIPIGASEKLSCGFKLPDAIDGHIVKVFVWEGKNLVDTKMWPLSKVVSLQ